jgi:YVTN family beta-propeller protein
LTRSSKRSLVPPIVITTALLGLAACGSSPSKTTTTTVVKQAPDVVALVTIIGAGSSLGSGTTVQALDLTPGKSSLTRTIATGTFPDAVAVAPDGKTAYVTNYNSNSVTPVNLHTGKPGKEIPAGSGPAGIAVAPNGKTAYVTDAGTDPIGDTVTPIDLKTDKPGTPIVVGDGPQGIAITPDGTTAYVADAGAIVSGQTGAIGKTVTPITLASGKALPPIPVGNAPVGIAVTPDGSAVYVTNANSGSVTPIATATNTASPAVEVDGSPQAVAISGTTVWVADGAPHAGPTNNLTPIPISSGTAGHPITVGTALTGVAISPDGSTAWVVSSGTSSLIPVDLTTATAEPAKAVATAVGPYALALVNELPSVVRTFLAPPPTKKTTKSATTSTS